MAGQTVKNRSIRPRETDRDILAVRNLSLNYVSNGEVYPVLRDVELTVQAGEFVAVFGPSGAGKSTLLRVIARLIEPNGGQVDFNAHHLSSDQAFGFVFQDPRLLPWRSVTGNVEYGLEGRGLNREQRNRRAIEVLSLVGLADQGSRWPRRLSGGQRQRVGIARALAVRPDILLMDEPFSSLDAITRTNLRNELLRIWETARTSILFVTHDLEEAVFLADRLMLLAGTPARVVREYPIAEPRPRDPRSPGFQELLREISRDLRAVSVGARLTDARLVESG